MLVLWVFISAASGNDAHVVGVTAAHAFFDAGRDEGLEVGAQVTLTRRGHSVGRCTLSDVGDHRASCATTVACIDDTFPLPDRGRAKVSVRQRPSRARVQTTLSAFAAVPMVVIAANEGASDAGGIFNGSVSVGHASYLRSGTSGYHVERLDVDLRAIRLGFLGAELAARATLLAWSSRPADARFRPDARFQLNVWEAEISSHERGRRFAVALGRVWTRHLPGLAVLDGGQVAYRSADGDFEAGVYGGLRPDPLTTAPALERWSVGAYYAFAHRGVGALRFLQHEARVGIRQRLRNGAQLEAEGAVLGDFAGWLSFGAALRAALDDFKTPAFDSARVHVTAKPLQTLRLVATARYLARVGDDLEQAVVSALLSGGTRVFGTLDANYQPLDWLQVGVTSFAAASLAERHERFGIGPEVALPKLFGRRGGLTMTHREEVGWMGGRTTALTAQLVPHDDARLLIRAAYQATTSTVATSTLLHELALVAYGDWYLKRWLGLRLSMVARMALSTTFFNGLGQLDVVGRF